MSKMMCPGQDSRFWKPEDTFEATCGQCGQPLEFFKDDATRRCTRCGSRVRNPRLNLGCAKWCEHARECLGFDPRDVGPVNEGESTCVDRLVKVLKEEFAGDPDRFGRSIRTLERAQKLLPGAAARPGVVLAAALIHGVPSEEDARRLLEKSGIDAPTIEDVVAVFDGRPGSSPESRIVSEAVSGAASPPEGAPPRSPTAPPDPR